MNPKQLTFYTALTRFLGKTLGSNFEVVLHVLDSGNYHLAAIENSHISGRTTNSPLTGFALELIKSNQHQTKDYLVNYKAETTNGKTVKGSTFFIKDDEQHLIAMLCINQDIHKYQELSDELLALGGLGANAHTSTHPAHHDTNKEESVEILEDSIEGMIYAIVPPELLNKNILLSKELKLEVISALEEKGVFQIKGAVARVADILNISEPSVYRYIKMVEH